jgi:four helix bundle protein
MSNNYQGGTMSISTFKELVAWQKAHKFVLEVYQQTREFPDHEKFGLTSQLRRAAVSIPANIAEGFARSGIADRMRFMNIAQGSIEECRYYLILSNGLGYMNSPASESLLEEVSKLVFAYRRSLARLRS